ncbi:hypothetical protein REPUB_Repub11eG0118200 [Reevesia pubescens]
MESDLLEISGEDDDSLLLQHHQPHNDGVSSFNPSFFSCSPFHFPRSHPPDEKAKDPSLLSNVNKENINNNKENKSQLPKLSLESQQMKRKKKGGGYNLRKSLAWDRAFFTEEGVLNSTELSLISGDFGKLKGGKLSVIEEERGELLSGESPALQVLENNNSKKKEEKKIGSSLLHKGSSSAPRSAVKQNVLSVHDVNRSGSKRSGCPRPVIPANVSTTKAAVKEPKVTKIPATKSNSSVLSTTAKIAPNINKPKRNQSAQAAVNAQRSIGMTGSNRSSRSTQNDAKSSLSSKSQITKSSAQQAKRNVGSSALASSQHPLVTKADNGLKVNQDRVVAAGHGSINHEAGSSKTAFLPQSGCLVSGNTQYAQPQMAKSSGLRMPSPSLGFFAQSKTNASHNLQSSTQLCNNPKSKLPKLQKLSVLNSICESPTSSMKEDVVTNDVAAITNAKEHSVPSSANSSCENIRPNSRASKMPRVEVKVPCNSDNYELTNNQRQLHTNDNDLRKQIENVGLQCSDNKLHLQSQSSEQVELDCKGRTDLVIPRSSDLNGDEFKDPCFNSHHSLQIEGAKADDVGNQLSGNEQHNSLMDDCDLFLQLHFGDVNSCNLHGSPKVNNDQISIHDGHEQSSKQAELAKPCNFDDDQIINEIERPHINEGTLLKEGEPLEEFLSYNSVQNKGICPENRDCSAVELERTNGLSHCRVRIQGKDGTAGADDLNLQSHVADEKIHALESNLSLESSIGLLNASEADNQHTLVNDVNKKIVEQPPLPDSGVVVERVFQDNYGSHSTDCLLHVEIISSEALLTESNLQSVKEVTSEIADARQREVENSSAPCWIPPALQNCVHEMNEEVECLHVENEASLSTDTQCNHNIELLCETTSSRRLERSGEEQVAGAITACDIAVSNDCQSSGNLNGFEMDNSHSISHLSQVVQFKDYSEVVDIINVKSIEGNQCHLSAKCNSTISEPAEKITSLHVDASAMLTNSLIDEQIDCETIAQAELIQSFEAGNAFAENQIPEAFHGLLSVEGKCFEESQNFDCDNCAEVGARDKSSIRGAVEGPSDLSQVEHTDEPNEKCTAGVNELSMSSFGEDAHLLSFDDGISFDSCKLNLFTSAENNNFAVVEDLNGPPELQNVVIVEPVMSDKFGYSVSEEVSDYVKITLLDNKHDCYNDMIRPENEQSRILTSFNFESSSLSEDQFPGNNCKLQVFSFSNEESTSSIKTNHTSSSGNVLQEEVNRLENDVPPEFNSSMIPVEAKGNTISVEKTVKDTKQDAPAVKPPLSAVPFSDEWLAAFEVAGEVILSNYLSFYFMRLKTRSYSCCNTHLEEGSGHFGPIVHSLPLHFCKRLFLRLEPEILTMKSGAVQNSPKDKSLPEPGPWSPVRRKNNQEIGPFDCTKFTNTNIPPGSD